MKAILKAGEYEFVMSSYLHELGETHAGENIRGLIQGDVENRMRIIFQKLNGQRKAVSGPKLLEFVEVMTFMKLDSAGKTAHLVSEFLDKHKVGECQGVTLGDK